MSVSFKEDIFIYNFNGNSSHDKYRYYNCYLDYKCIRCKEINSPSSENKDINKKSKLIYINKYFPKIFDKLFIYYDFLPDKIKIDNFKD
jgi:hypothetical protein